MPRVLLIYRAADSTLLRYIIPDSEAELHDSRHIQAEEVGIIADIDSDYPDESELEAILAENLLARSFDA